MKILGLIVEYNPFHLGHLYHLQQAQQKLKPAATIAVMSGSFTQRGEPAIVDKWARAQMALAAGIDLVLELPVAWATQSAPNFAAGAVRLLAAAGATDICFGSEIGNLAPLQTIADLLLEEPPSYQQALQNALRQGHSFAVAQGHALAESLPNINPEVFKQPNNTLGIMYLLAMKQYHLSMQAHTIKRVGSYHSLDTAAPLPSATAIRQQVLKGHPLEGMPSAAQSILAQQIQRGQGPVTWKHFAPLLFYQLRNQTRADMDTWPESGEGLGDRLWLAARQTNHWEELLRMTKTRRFPLTRLQRVATYILLGLNRDRLARINLELAPPYLRVLALNTGSCEARRLLRESQLPVIYAARTAPSTEPRLCECLQMDIRATDIYTLAWEKNSRSGLDYTHPVITC